MSYARGRSWMQGLVKAPRQRNVRQETAQVRVGEIPARCHGLGSSVISVNT